MDELELTTDQQRALRGKRPLSKSYIARHWRGELSLPRSYWVNTVLLNVIVFPLAIRMFGVAGLAVVHTNLWAGLALVVAMYACLLFWLLPVTIWQLVGLWRSATSYQLQGGFGGWGALVKCQVFLGWIVLAWAGLTVVDGITTILSKTSSRPPLTAAHTAGASASPSPSGSVGQTKFVPPPPIQDDREKQAPATSASATPRPFDATQSYEVVATPSPASAASKTNGAASEKWWEKDQIAYFETGLAYYNGAGVEKDYSEAVKWFRKAAEQNHAQAQLYLAACYAGGEGVPTDLAEAARWARKAADQNFAPAQAMLGSHYLYGWGLPKNSSEAVKWFRKAADQNDYHAEYDLGECYRNGEGVGRDYAEAMKLYRKAAEQNYASAQRALGDCYYFGRGVSKNYTEAVKWYRKAADQGDASAQASLANCYHDGQGVAKNYGEAVKWYRKRAEQDDPLAALYQYTLGYWYYTGHAVRRDYAEAVKWFRKAAEQNFEWAQNSLGDCYYFGRGVPKDYSEAVKWYRKSADQNNSAAQRVLALRYLQGEGVPKDYVESYKWLLLAAAQGDERSTKTMPLLETLMSREQIAEGQKLAREFTPRKTPATETESSNAAAAETRPKSAGTGFFITEDGHLLTNAHVAGNAAQVRLVTAFGLISAKVLKVDSANDLALLKAEGKFQALPVATSRAVKLGSTVISVGFPNIVLQGFAPKFARGEIASLTGPQDDPRFFQISVPLQPGNSGGSLVDERGNVVGVVSGKLSAAATLKATGQLPENVNYAVKSSFVLGFLESVPEVASKLKEPNTSALRADDVVEKAKAAAVLVLVY